MSNDNTTQEKILSFIRKSVLDRGFPPSVREIGAAIGLKSTSTVHGHLARLEKKGLLRRDPTLPRAMAIVGDVHPSTGTHGIPIIGKVAAGEPITAIQSIEDVCYLPDSLVGKADCFFLVIQGDSMIDAGINDGDYVLVRKQNTADNGEIVVVLVDDEATVKRIYREDDHFRLQPENTAMEPILVDDCVVQGKVIGLFRRFR